MFTNISSLPQRGLNNSLNDSIRGSFNILIAPQNSDKILDLGFLDDVVIKPTEVVSEVVSQNRGSVSDTFISDLTFEITCSMFEYSYDFLKTALSGSLVFDEKQSLKQDFLENVKSLSAMKFYPLSNQNIDLSAPLINHIKKDSNVDITDYDLIQASGIWGVVLKSDCVDIEISYSVSKPKSRDIYFTSSGQRPKLMLLAYQKEKDANGKMKARGFKFFNVTLQNIPTITAKSVKDQDSLIRFPLSFKATASFEPIVIDANKSLDKVVCQYIEEEL